MGGSGGPLILPNLESAEEFFVRSLVVFFEDYPNAKDLYECESFRQLVYNDSAHEQIITYLLDNGIMPADRYSMGKTILHLAACRTPQRVKALLENQNIQLDVDAKDKDGRTALHYAAARGRADVMEILLKHGANTLVRDNHHATVLHFGVNSVECTQLSIDNGADVNAQDNFCRTPLHYAVLVEEPDGNIEALLIASGARSGTVDLDGKTADYYWSLFNNTGCYRGEECTRWLERRFLDCNELRLPSLFSAIDNASCYNQNFAYKFSSQIKQAAEESKTWIVVSDSEDEDFEPPDN